MLIQKVFKRLWRTVKAVVTGPFWYVRDLLKYKGLMGKDGVNTKMYYVPLIFDRDPASHTFDKHYVYMDRWAFKHLLEQKPASHVDIGSSIRFLSVASTVAKTTFVDIRPVKPDFDNFEVKQGSILALPYADNSLSSVSCLHVAEHIGLGRYGDPLDPLGTKKACAELARVLAPGGKLYFAVPVGKNATYFNAHRVHSPSAILNYFAGLKLESFATVNDAGHFVETAKPEDYEQAWYACGCFVFTKI
jgi:SAM-dependent methyltransferase